MARRVLDGGPRLSLDDDLRGLVRVGVVSAAPVAVAPASPALVAELASLAAEMRTRHGGRRPAEIRSLAAARELYRGFGIDPTKTRPSSEALLRRVLAGRSLPSIANAVDLGNLLSLRFLLPIGLYDRRRIEGPGVVLRRGRVGESYTGIRRGSVHLEGRPVLVDARGPFGNPTADSLRTSVQPGSVALWMTIFAPRSVPETRLRDHVETARRAFERHLGTPSVAPETSGEALP